MEPKLKKSRGIARAKFTRKVTYLEEKLDAEEPFEVTKLIYDELQSAFYEVERRNDKLAEYYETLEAEGIHDLVKEADDYIDLVDKKRLELFSRVMKTKLDPSSVKVKSLPAPTFSGDIRKFGTFIKDYKRLMLTSFGENPYAFYSCLLGK